MWEWLGGDPYPFATKVMVHTKRPDERSFRGVLWRERRGFLVLRQAELMKSGGVGVPVDGEVLVARGEVAFMQVLGPEQP